MPRCVQGLNVIDLRHTFAWRGTVQMAIQLFQAVCERTCRGLVSSLRPKHHNHKRDGGRGSEDVQEGQRKWIQAHKCSRHKDAKQNHQDPHACSGGVAQATSNPESKLLGPPRLGGDLLIALGPEKGASHGHSRQLLIIKDERPAITKVGAEHLHEIEHLLRRVWFSQIA
jgi:hypothetical protein